MVTISSTVTWALPLQSPVHPGVAVGVGVTVRVGVGVSVPAPAGTVTVGTAVAVIVGVGVGVTHAPLTHTVPPCQRRFLVIFFRLHQQNTNATKNNPGRNLPAGHAALAPVSRTCIRIFALFVSSW